MKPWQIILLFLGLTFLGFLMFQQTPKQTVSKVHITQESVNKQAVPQTAINNDQAKWHETVSQEFSLGQREGVLFVDPIEPVLVELPGDAIPYWQAVSAGEPSPLVMLSLHPLLQPIPESLKERALTLSKKGTPEDFLKHGRFSSSDPFILSTQSVRATVDSGMLNQLVWIFPTRSPIEDIDPITFRQQMKDLGFLSRENADNLKYTSGIFNGKISDFDLSFYHPDTIGPLPNPVIVHCDLSYFKGIYKNPVSTPIYGLLHQTASAIRKAGWNVKLVTLSFSNESLAVSLDVRFLMTALAEMIRKPELLDAGLPPAWEKRAQAMYAGAMYMESDAKKLVKAAAESHPEDAATLYDMAMLNLQQGKNKEGVDLLAEAVRLDSGYASSYLMLGERNAEIGNHQQAFDFGQKAKSHFRHNTFIDIGMVESLIALERYPDALDKLETLQTLDWSGEYHPDVPEYLNHLKTTIEAALQASPEQSNNSK